MLVTWLSDIWTAARAANADWTLEIEFGGEFPFNPTSQGLEPWTDERIEGGELWSVKFRIIDLNPVADGLDPTDLSSPSSDERLSGSSMSDWLSGMSAKQKNVRIMKNTIMLFLNADVAQIANLKLIT